MNNEMIISEYVTDSEVEENIVTYEDIGWINIYVDSLDSKIHNGFFDLEYINDDGTTSNADMHINFQIKDDGNALYRTIPSIDIYELNDRTKYVSLNFSGNAQGVHLSVPRIDYTKGVRVKSIKFNTYWPYHFSPHRLMVVLFGIICCYYFLGFIKEDSYFFELNTNKIVGPLFVISISILSLYFMLGIKMPHMNAKTQYHDLTEAIARGNVYLDEAPSDTIINMDNPYDNGLRDELLKENGDNFRLDVAYYNGKYYVYFGILPVILFFLPFYLVTGYHISIGIVLSILLILYYISCYLFLFELNKIWHRNILTRHFFLSYILLILAGNGLYAMRSKIFYAVPILFSISLVLLGLSLLIKWKFNNNNIYIVLGSFLIGLTAACRPQFLIAILFIPILVFDDCKSFVKIFCFCLIPLSIVAIFVGYYNYIRFGEWFEFGANYNLTGNDMTHRGWHSDRICLGLFYYLFALPEWGVRFPFLSEIHTTTGYMGFTWFEALTGGIISNHPIIFLNLLVCKLSLFVDEKKEKIFILICILCSFVVIIADVQLAGIFSRYMMDFGYLIGISTVLVFLNVYNKYRNEGVTSVCKLLDIAFVTSIAYSIIYWAMQMFVFDGGMCANKDIYYLARELIEFW